MRRDRLFLGTDVEAGGDVLLDPKELTTHAFCVGMTGSGKTGLCSVLIEELLDKGVPVIAVDPKGDLGNLLLPVDPADPSSFGRWAPPGTDGAVAAAAMTEGLAASGLSAEDLRAYRAGHRVRLVTPGATFGKPVNVLGALSAPKAGEDANEAADTVVRSLLGLLSIDADPIRSREYLLLHALVKRGFDEGKAVTLPDLVRQIADPPVAEVGALPLEQFFPKKERMPLMLAVNGLLASPAFAAWRQGEPLDLDAWLSPGKPTLTVYSIAHLSETERIFALTLLLERALAWMRKQPGTGALRAVLYVDEIYGFFPPHPHDPPTKRPLLTLLKQARAFGLGVVLATQNPVDLDYKGLANTGTWFVGRLQTEGDRARLRDGLVSAATISGQSAPDVQAMLAKLEKRVFLLHSIHRSKPTLLKSRYAYSFLRGPLSREEIAALSQSEGPATVATPAVASASEPILADGELGPLYEEGTSAGEAHLFLKFAVKFKVGRESTEEETFTVAFPLAEAASVEEALEAEGFPVDEATLSRSRPATFTVRGAPAWLSRVDAREVQRVVKARLPSKLKTKLFLHPDTKLLSRPGETLDQFLARATAFAATFTKTAELESKLEKKRRDMTLLQEEVQGRNTEKWAQVGTAVLGNVGLLFGKKRTISGVGGVLSKQRMANAAEGRLEALAAEVKELYRAVQDLKVVTEDELQETEVAAQAKDVAVFRVAIAYL